MDRRFYYDNSATTNPSSTIRMMMPYLMDTYGNPSSIHKEGRAARSAIDTARHQVAEAIHAKDSEITFTSGGSESNNLAIKGAVFAAHRRDPHLNHIITTQIEHPSVLNTCKWLESIGFEVTYLPVDKHGYVDPHDVFQAIKPSTILVSVMLVNNEIGTIEPIKQIGKLTRQKKVLLHTDAVQAIGIIEIDPDDMGVDLLSMSGHKFGAPKGVGALYVREGVQLEPLIHGGGQENGLRSGTENVAAIACMGMAIEETTRHIKADVAHLSEVGGDLYNRIKQGLSRWPHCNCGYETAPHILSLSFPGIDAESLVMMLDNMGVAVSAGSACSSESVEPSHVLKAIGLPDEYLRSTIRISLSKSDSFGDVLFTSGIIVRAIKKLEEMSGDETEDEEEATHTGRPTTTINDLPEKFIELYPLYNNRQLKKIDFARQCGLSRPTLDKYIKLYESER